VDQERDGARSDRFEREARAFARSPLHRDPERLRRLVEFSLAAPGESGLDVACGPGIVAAGLAAAGAATTAVDRSAGMLREAANSGAARARAAAERLPFRDAVFDLVVCRNSFHHFDSPGMVMAEMARVARRGGRVVIEDMVAAEDLRERDAQEVIERLRDTAHARTLPRTEFLTLAQAAGLRVVAETRFLLVVDFDEWIDRPRPSPQRRARAVRLMEERAGAPEGGLRSWIEEGRLRFERPSLLLRAVRG
jgi:ubiquinone/menaquinone biosynthesis C-methylase UbiE